MSDLTVPQGAYGYNLAFTVQDSTATAYNLSGYTVTLKIWKEDLETDTLVSAACTVDVAASGTCHYAVQSGDFDEEGDYLLGLELTKTGVVENTRHYTLEVEQSA